MNNDRLWGVRTEEGLCLFVVVVVVVFAEWRVNIRERMMVF